MLEQLYVFGKSAIKLPGLFVPGWIIRLDLHVSVFAVIKLGPPSTVEEWGFRACILYEAFQFHQVPGMLVGRESYSCEWLVRTFMVSFMRSEHVPCVKIEWFDKITDLNGPDLKRLAFLV